MWSSRKRGSETQLVHDKRNMPAFDTVVLHSNVSSLRQNCSSNIPTEKKVLSWGPKAQKIRHGGSEIKEENLVSGSLRGDYRTGNAEGALVPVLLRITHWTKSGLPVSLPGLYPPCLARRTQYLIDISLS